MASDSIHETASLEEHTLSSLITYTKSVGSVAADARAAKYQLLLQLKVVTSIYGITNCCNKIRIYNPAHLSHERIITNACGNRHACPVCTSKYMAKKRELIAGLMSDHRSNGGEVCQSVLQQSNKPHSPLISTLPTLNDAWNRMVKSTAWRKLTQKYGLHGYVRLQETAYGPNGWFPHFHCIWFFSGPRSELEMQDFLVEVFDLWAHHSAAAGAPDTLAASQKMDLIESGSEAGFAWYLTKHGYLDLMFDPAKVDLSTKTLTPFQLLTWAFYTSDADLFGAWADFEIATAHSKRVVVSRNLHHFLQD